MNLFRLFTLPTNNLFKATLAEVNLSSKSGSKILSNQSAKLLINNNSADVNARSSSGRTSLFDAIYNNRIKVANLLINNGADVNARSNYGQTPLFNAKNVNTAKLLIDNGADVNARDHYGQTPLFWERGDHSFSMSSCPNDNGKNSTCYEPINGEGKQYIDLVKLLIKNGADVNTKDLSGETPLFILVRKRFVSVIEPLIKMGADVNARDNNGKTPLFFAKDQYVANSLIKNGADINVRDNQGNSPKYK